MNGRRSRPARAACFPAARRRSAGFRSASRRVAPMSAVELKDTQPPLALKLKEILVVAQVWDPKLLIAEFTGPLTISDPGQPPYVTASWTLAQAACAARRDARARLDRVDDLKFDGAAPGTPLFDAKHAEFHARVQFGSWPQQSGGRSRGEAQGRDRARARSLHARSARCRHPGGAARHEGSRAETVAGAPARMAGVGGGSEIQNARVAQGEALATATGTLALTQRGRLDGALQLNVAGLREAAAGRSAQQQGRGARASIAPRRRSTRSIAPCPALARASRRRRRTSAVGLLGLLGKPVDIEGKRGVTVPVRFTRWRGARSARFRLGKCRRPSRTMPE